MSTERDLYGWADACLLPGFTGYTAPDWVRRRVAEGLGGVALYHDNVADTAQLSKLTGELRAERADVLIAIDEEGGDVTRLEIARGSSWPGNHALGRADDTELTRQVAAGIGRTLAETGVSLDFGPVADVNTTADNPVIGVRSFGSDPERVAAHTAAYVDGLQSTGVAACAKHFPGHGGTVVDSHHDLPVVHDAESVFESTAFPPFRAAIEAGVRSVMTAHITVPAFDTVPATLSAPILTGLLRRRLGYTGVVITDSLEMEAVSRTFGITEGGVRAVIAGADLLCTGTRDGEQRVHALREALVAAVRDGRLPEQRLAEAAERVRALSGWTGRGGGRGAGTGAGRGAERGTAQGADPGAGTDGGRGSGQGAARGAETPLGLVAARRALHAVGITPLTAPPLVVELGEEPNPAVGRTSWGLGRTLQEALPTTTVRSYHGPDDRPLDELRHTGPGTPLVVTVRDRHRHPWIAAAVAELVAARPDTVLVEMGLPYGTPPARHYIHTHGAARVCAQAAAELLLGRELG
ncbi:glycoside hydrolase family 3 N-terminal domain-containing protein [Streptomyces sp. NPDC094032]|uniref:glycoside hydrolase family 3 protein n=1 Tax=Streptomyces sp. NPDC094032 TaxID=3155308 RepID=UPI003316AFF6